MTPSSSRCRPPSFDPDGDAVTLLGIGSAPRLGRLVKFGANSVHYQAYPGSAGTDEFTYQVTDPFGGVGSRSARSGLRWSNPGAPQPPLAVPDVPHRRARPDRDRVDVLANDLLAAGDRATVELVDPPDGVEPGESDSGPVVIEAPDKADGRNVEVVYRLGNGIDASRARSRCAPPSPTTTRRSCSTRSAPRDEGDSVSIDALETAYDPDGPRADQLKIAEVFAPQGVTAKVEGSKITVPRGKQPIVVPFRVEDADGGAATASLFVPATEVRSAVHEVRRGARGRPRRSSVTAKNLRPGHQPARRPGGS